MKILEINSFFTVGGPPRIVNGIYDTLIEEGHECKIAAARERMYAPKDSIQIGSNLGVKINALKARIFDNEGFNARRATRKLIKDIEKYNPDVIHLHNLHGYYINIEILFDYLKKSGKPVVWTLHDCWALTGHCAYFDYSKCDQWMTACEKCKNKKNYPTSYLANRAKRNYQKKKAVFTSLKNLTIVTPSRWLADLVERTCLGKYPIKVIRNGIDTKVFRQINVDELENKSFIDKKIILGIAQVWDKRKGLEYFFELNKIMPNDWKIILVGLDDSQIKTLPKNILGIKKTQSVNELVKLYNLADVFVNPTLEDNYPTTNIEAVACGTPVVTFCTGGSPETLVEGMGYLTEEKNAESLKQTIEKALNKNSDEIIIDSKFFDKEHCYQEYVTLFEGIVNE